MSGSRTKKPNPGPGPGPRICHPYSKLMTNGVCIKAYGVLMFTRFSRVWVQSIGLYQAEKPSPKRQFEYFQIKNVDDLKANTCQPSTRGRFQKKKKKDNLSIFKSKLSTVRNPTRANHPHVGDFPNKKKLGFLWSVIPGSQNPPCPPLPVGFSFHMPPSSRFSKHSNSFSIINISQIHSLKPFYKTFKKQILNDTKIVFQFFCLS